MNSADTHDSWENLPPAFVNRLKEILPPSRLGAVCASFSVIRPTSFRVNLLKCTAAALHEELKLEGLAVEEVPWLPGAFIVEQQQRRSLTESSAFYEGRLYIQGLSSMLAPLLLEPRPGERVLDLAAAPGGKTLQIAAMMNNRGVISAVESVRGRFFRLQSNLSRHGVKVAKTYLMDGRAVGSKVPERFDRVLLDAPCSSEARFHTGKPQSWSHWSLRKVKESARKQRRLLVSAARSLKVGGVLLYSTCSFAPEENEQVIDDLLRRYPRALKVDTIQLPLENLQPGLEEWNGRNYDVRLKRAIRVLPTALMGGFFLCKLTKVDAVD